MTANKNKFSFKQILILLVAVLGFSTSAFAQKATTLRDLIRDKGCSIVLDVQRDLWRDADISDYQTSGWKAWMAQTKSPTPWRVTGDFDGDGLEDVAKVVIRKADNVWMMGVEFGFKNKSECRRQQIASNSIAPNARLVGLLKIPKNNAKFVCHHISETYPANCIVPDEGLLARREADAFMTTDDIPTRTDGYVWEQYRDYTKDDGTPQMAFESELIRVEADLAAMAAAMNKDKEKPQAGDKVSPAERRALIVQLDAAFNNADKRNYRITIRSVSTIEGKPYATEYTVDFALPNKVLTTMINAAKSETITLRDGPKSWVRANAAGVQGAWRFLGEGDASDLNTGAGLGKQPILAVRTEIIAGRKVKIVEVGDAPPATANQTIFSIDEASKLPVRRVDKGGGSVTTSTYDFEIKLNFPPTPATK